MLQNSIFDSKNSQNTISARNFFQNLNFEKEFTIFYNNAI